MTKYTEISKTEALSRALKLKMPSNTGQLLFKGIGASEPIGNFLIYDPKSKIRASVIASTQGNSYNLLLNNLPAWQSWPLRERSIIASTSVETAASFAAKGDFGKTYVLIADDSSQFVVAPSSDIWYSFSKCFKILGLPEKSNSLKQFNVFLAELAHIMGFPDNFDRNWDVFKRSLAVISNKDIPWRVPVSNSAKQLHKVFRSNRRNLMAFLDRAFAPHENDFSVVAYSEILTSKRFPENEVWTNSNCLFVELGEYRKVVEDLKE